MTERNLKKLSRKQLLELLLEQTKRADELEAQLLEAQKRIEDRTIAKNEAGSIAEAALRLNGVFEAAEAAVAQYIENIKRLSDKHTALNEHAEAMARKKAEVILSDVERRCRIREEESAKRIIEISAKLEQMHEQKRMLDDVFKDFAVIHNDGE